MRGLPWADTIAMTVRLCVVVRLKVDCHARPWRARDDGGGNGDASPRHREEGVKRLTRRSTHVSWLRRLNYTGLLRRNRLAMTGVFRVVWLCFYERTASAIGVDCRGRLRALAMTGFSSLSVTQYIYPLDCHGAFSPSQ